VHTGKVVESYAGDHTELLPMAEELRVGFAPYGAPMSFMARKSRYYGASNLLRNRDALGRARREKTPR
jgi:hypothetical protein